MSPRCLNEVQFPEELQRGHDLWDALTITASMKCSSRRNCSPIPFCLCSFDDSSLNEVQFPEELQHRPHERTVVLVVASMKCSSRRNCSLAGVGAGGQGEASMKCSSRRNCSAGGQGRVGRAADASMKCSSRRNCSPRGAPTRASYPHCLNEVQFPEELQPADTDEVGAAGHRASMKCSSRRNCSRLGSPGGGVYLSPQ